MATLPYMQFYPGDYLADTGHLTTVQHGAYLLIIMNYWQRGSALVDDDERLAATARLTVREWKKHRKVIKEFFIVSGGVWIHRQQYCQVRFRSRRAYRYVPRDIRLLVLSIGRCLYCGSVESLEVDHIIPVSRGGSNYRSNLQCLCRSCNARKGNL